MGLIHCSEMIEGENTTITPSKLNKKYVMKSVSDAQKKFDPFDKTINSIVFNTLI